MRAYTDDNMERTITKVKVKARISQELKLLNEGFGPTDIARKMNIHRATVYRDFDELGEETKKELFSLNALVTEVEWQYYNKRVRIMNQINILEDLLKKKPGTESLIKSLVKLEYVLNRIDSDRIENLQRLRVVPERTVLKKIQHSGGYVRFNQGVYPESTSAEQG